VRIENQSSPQVSPQVSPQASPRVLYNPDLPSSQSSSFKTVASNFQRISPAISFTPNLRSSPAASQPGSNGFGSKLAALVEQFRNLGTSFQTASAATQQRVTADKANGVGVLEGAKAYSAEILGGLKAAGIGGSGGAGALGAAGAWSGTIGAVGNLVGIFSAGDNIKPKDAAIGGAVNGAYIGTQILPGWGTAIGAVVGGIAGFASSYFGSGKSKDQKARDQVRGALQQAGVIDEKYCLTLANGSKFDIGKDGGAKLTNMDGSERRMYEVDLNNPLSAQAVGLANPLAHLVSGGDKKLATAFTGYFTNAAMSNAASPDDVRQNMLAIFSKFNIGPEQVMGALQQLGSAGKITTEEYGAFARG